MRSRDILPTWLTGSLTPAEEAVIDVLVRRFSIIDTNVLAAAALTVLAQRAGHSCVDLRHVADLIREQSDKDDELSDLSDIPPPTVFVDAFRRMSNIVQIVSDDLSHELNLAKRDGLPFVLMDHYLYTQRQFIDEASIALQVSGRTRGPSKPLPDEASVDRVVPMPDPHDDAAMRAGDTGIANRAAKSFVARPFTVLTGGPGTGKTFTLTRCLAAFLTSREQSARPPRLALVAPTGKAATRAKDLLSTFVEEQRTAGEQSLGLPDSVLEELDRLEAQTIHRLLGSKARLRTRFVHDEDRPLDVDVLIVDEMSMVPSALMARLLEAMRPEATILLVGDQAQLEAVESGSVLREIVEFGKSQNQPEKWSFELLRVWRQSNDTHIGDLARAIRRGDSPTALDLVSKNSHGIEAFDSVSDLETPDSPLGSYLAVLEEVRILAESTNCDDHKAALEKVSRNKLLCGPRRGKLGVHTWNSLLREQVLGSIRGDSFEPGVPLLVTVNSTKSRLVNGDIGLVVNTRDDDGSITRAVYFSDGHESRYISPAQLPPTEVCYAMTIHKSQGSEYDHVVVILPNNDSPLLNRELVYTAVTRAKKQLTIVGRSEQLSEAIDTRSERHSALRVMLSTLSE